MRRLTPDQAVAVTVADITVDCRVALAAPDQTRLVAIDPAGRARLPAASVDAELVFSHQGRLVMLRGAIHHGVEDGEIGFTQQRSGATRATPTNHRRRHARLPITLPVALWPLGENGEPGAEPHRLVTRDLSIGGLAVEMRGTRFAVGAVSSIALVLSDGATIEGTARVVRVEDGVAALAFEELQPLQRVRLAGFLAGRQAGRGAPAAPAGGR